MDRWQRAVACATAVWVVSASGAGMDRTKLNIGAYYLKPYAQTERHVREAKDCGIDFFAEIEAMTNGAEGAVLDLFQKYGMGAFVYKVTPSWNGGPTRIYRSVEKEHPFDGWSQGARRYRYRNHPAVWGYAIADEPGALSFPFFRRVISALQKEDPDKTVFFNLLPNVAPKEKPTEPFDVAVAKLVKEHPNLAGRVPDVAPKDYRDLFIFFQAKDYEDYVAKYCEQIPLDYLSYDLYPYKGPERRLPLCFENMKTVADACRRTGRDFWNILQVNSYYKDKPISVDGLRYQAYQAMAYGATTLMWACYTAGWWHHQVLDEKGEKTEQYEKLKTVNAEIHRFGGTYMRYRNVATHLVGDYGNPKVYFRAPKEILLPSEKSGTQTVLQRYDGAFFTDLRASGDEALMIGEMVGRRDAAERALFIAAADDPMEKGPHAYEIVFSPAPGRKVRAFGTTGELPISSASDGSCRVPIRSNGAVLVTSEPAQAEALAPWNTVSLRSVPETWPAEDVKPGCEGVKSVWIEGEPCGGKPTRFFAHYGLPANAAAGCPGIVLVHGGEGTAFDWWVKMWNDRGYAAIAMDTCGAIPVKDPATKKWGRHEWSGPEGWGRFTEADRPIRDQWTYHAVAAVIRSHNFLRSLPGVDGSRIGITGISWGGYLTCIAAGVDPRFRFAVPVYGCGFYMEEGGAWKKQIERLGKTGKRWMSLWDAGVYLPNAKCPFLWVSGKDDPFFPYSALRKSAALVKAPVEYAVSEHMTHGQKAGSSPECIREFADRQSGVR